MIDPAQHCYTGVKWIYRDNLENKWVHIGVHDLSERYRYQVTQEPNAITFLASDLCLGLHQTSLRHEMY